MGLLAAPHYLKPAPNFILIINHNKLAQDAAVDLGPLDEVARLYRWHTERVDGHDLDALSQAYHRAVEETSLPSLILCDTVKGKGGDPAWEGRLGRHGRPPKTDEEYRAYVDGLDISRGV